jgi:hypothetical protein
MAATASAIPASVIERTRPLSLAGERMLAVHPQLADLFPDGGLRRGSVLACEGPVAMSLAFGLVVAASQSGSWAGVVGLPQIGGSAMAELGIALERVFLVAAPPPSQWAAALAAVADGVDVVLAPGGAIRPSDARRLTARLTAKGGVMITVGGAGGFGADVTCTTTVTAWEGLGRGSGRLLARRVTVQAAGRRIARPRTTELWLPGPTGAIAAVAPSATETGATRSAVTTMLSRTVA